MLHADGQEIASFVDALFRYADPGTVIGLRSFEHQPGTPARIQGWPKINGDLSGCIQAATRAATEAANADRPMVFAPPVATFNPLPPAPGEKLRASEENLANGVALSVELDQGDTRAIQRRLEQVIGPATVVVASGGVWDDPNTGECFDKLHLHWRLSEPTREAAEHARLKAARRAAMLLAGADGTAVPPVHPLRWPGSWHRKGHPRLAMTAGGDKAAEIHLDEALDRLEEAVEAAGLKATGTAAPTVSSTPQAALPRITLALATIPNTEAPWDEWVRMGMMLYRATAGSVDGLVLWDEWSAKAGKHVPGACEERWTHFAGSPPTRIGAGTLFFMAKAHGWTEQAPGPTEAGPPEPHPDDPGAQPLDADLEPEAAPRRSRRKDTGEIAWGEPVDFFAEDTLGAPELAPHHIPDALWAFVQDTAARMGVDPYGVALGALVTCASVINESWKLQPRRRDYSWTESARLWGAILGDPSMMKTPQIAACTKPLEKLDRRARELYAEGKRIHAQRLTEHKAALKKGENSVEPRLKPIDRYMVEGTTVEALQDVLRDDDEAKQNAPAGKVLVRHDELSEWFANLDRYKGGGSGGGDRAAYLRLYNGGHYSIDRVGRGFFAVKNWSACLLGGCQPGPIQKVARDTTDDGLLQRFLWCVPSRQGGGIDRAPDQDADQRYDALFPALLAMEPARDFDKGFARSVVLHADAHELRQDVESIARAMSAMPDTPARLKSSLGKWGGQFARIVLTFHMINLADARARGELPPPAEVVPVETVERAAALMIDVVLPHLLRAHAVMFSTNQTGHAQWIAGLILDRGGARLTTRDVTRAYGPLRAPEAARERDEVMKSLVAVGWLEPEESPNPAKPTHAWAVNPAVHTVFKVRGEKERAARQAAKEAAAADIENLQRRRKLRKEP